MPHSVPNYLSTDANGNVSAQFTGNLDLLASSNPAFPPQPPTSEIRWHETTFAGFTAMEIIGRSLPGTNDSYAITHGSGTKLASATTRADVVSDNSEAEITVQAIPGQGGKVLAGATNPGGTFRSAIVQDGDGYSSFLQISGAGGTFTRLRSFLALVTFTWPGGTPFSNAVDLSAIAGYTVGASVATMPGDWQNRNFICEPFHPAGAGSLLQAKATQGGAVVNPVGGVTNQAYVVAITG